MARFEWARAPLPDVRNISLRAILELAVTFPVQETTVQPVILIPSFFDATNGLWRIAMKKMLFGTLGLVAMAVPALAADLPDQDLQPSSSAGSSHL